MRRSEEKETWSLKCEAQAGILKGICELHNAVADTIDDSIKINFDNGWVLLIPKHKDSSINVISHAYSMEYAQEISDIFTDEISKN